MDGQKDATMTAATMNDTDTVAAACGTPAGIVKEPTKTATARATTIVTTTSTAVLAATSLTALEMHYFKAVSLYRRRNYEKCVEVCNAMLQAGHEHNVQMFATPLDDEDDLHNGIGIGIGFGMGMSMGIGIGMGGSTLNTSKSGGGNGKSGGGGGGNRVYSSNLQRAAGSTASSSSGGPRGQLHALRSRYTANSSNIYSNNNTNNNNTNNNNTRTSTTTAVIMPTWLMEDVWQLKMRALTQRVYIDDLETNDDANTENEEVEFERIATAARPGSSIKSAFVPRPSTSSLRSAAGTAQSRRGLEKPSTVLKRPMSTTSTRPKSGMVRPGTSLSRPGSSLGSRPASRCGTASRVRATSAAAFNIGDVTAALFQASRLNPTIYAERQVLVKALFQFLFYHEAEVQKALSLCEAVISVQKQKKGRNQSVIAIDWWWLQQMGRCLLTLHYPRKAEIFLKQSIDLFPHPDTYLLLARVYQRLDQTDMALQLINNAVDRHPFDVTFRTEQGRIFDALSKPDDAMQIYRLISRLNPINIEALACIGLNYFYDNNPEMALMYYRRILSLGVHSAELYCNIALCCLYGGQIDLVLPCFQRALATAKTIDQKADIWYNLSFVAITTGDFNLGRRCLQLCLTSDGSNGAALNNLAVLSAYAGDIMKAKSYLNAAKEVLQDSEEIEANLLYMDMHYKL